MQICLLTLFRPFNSVHTESAIVRKALYATPSRIKNKKTGAKIVKENAKKNLENKKSAKNTPPKKRESADEEKDHLHTKVYDNSQNVL